MTIEQWIAYGVANGFCSEAFCDEHEGSPMSETEIELFDTGIEMPCRTSVRLHAEEQWEQDALGYKRLLPEL